MSFQSISESVQGGIAYINRLVRRLSMMGRAFSIRQSLQAACHVSLSGVVIPLEGLEYR